MHDPNVTGFTSTKGEGKEDPQEKERVILMNEKERCLF